jgi:hypothetical protein
MLHIHNGDSSAQTLKKSGVPGEHLPFREILIAGPTPQGLSPAEWRSTRARFLAANYGRDEAEYHKDLVEQDDALRSFRDHEEVILWFEHDLFCQIHLVYLLAWFCEQERGNTRLSLICINQFPGIQNFQGLGQLNPAQMASLFGQQHQITDAEFELASAAWRAFCSADPTDIETLLGQDISALPFLWDALLRHLARYPSTRNGLGHIENQALQLIAAGRTEFKSLFPAFWMANAEYGIGDDAFWNELKRMQQAMAPLLLFNGFDDFQPGFGKEFLEVSFGLTEKGREVMAGSSDFIEANGIDLWLGGLHLTEDNLWRWDEQERKLIRV